MVGTWILFDYTFDFSHPCLKCSFIMDIYICDFLDSVAFVVQSLQFISTLSDPKHELLESARAVFQVSRKQKKY